MIQKLKILHLEDSADEAELVRREIMKAKPGSEILHVDNEENYRQAITDFKPDIILSDHCLPSFDSHDALRILREARIQLPFILVTATVSEEYAVTVIRDGADDYILKDRLQRLVPAMESAVEKYEAAKARIAAEESVKISERMHRLLFEYNPLPMWMIAKSDLSIIAVNQAACLHYGYSREEFVELHASDLRTMQSGSRDSEEHLKAGTRQHIKKDGAIISVEIAAQDVVFEQTAVRLVIANDVTEKLQYESALAEERADRERAITETAIRTQEREREELGKELHDNINQLLATAILYMDFAVKKDALESEALAGSRAAIFSAIEEIRKLSHNLAGPSFESISLDNAIAELVATMSAFGTIPFSFDAGNYQDEEVNKDIKLMLFRVVQEQLNNILKHSHATEGIIQLQMTEQAITLLITDNGNGFEVSDPRSGIGLRNMETRIAYYKGQMEVKTAPGMGCSIKVSVPY